MNVIFFKYFSKKRNIWYTITRDNRETNDEFPNKYYSLKFACPQSKE